MRRDRRSHPFHERSLRPSFGSFTISVRSSSSHTRGRFQQQGCVCRRRLVLSTRERTRKTRTVERARSIGSRKRRGVRGNVGGDVVRSVDARCGDRGADAWTREERRFKREQTGVDDEWCFDRREIVAREGWGEDEEGKVG